MPLEWELDCTHTLPTPESRYFVFCGDQIYATEQGSLDLQQWQDLSVPATRELYVGRLRGQPFFAVDVPAEALDASRCASLYSLLWQGDDLLFSMAARAIQLLRWQRDHRFCGRCGQSLAPHPVERAMWCQPCGLLAYPRVSPCVIVLVTRGPELLLARNSNFPPGMFSTLAGFVEAGETLEQALFREVYEEVGVEIGNIRYFGSQTWPFPHQLMVGFLAEYTGGALRVDGQEIVEANWWLPEALPQVPGTQSISGQLIAHHVSQWLSVSASGR